MTTEAIFFTQIASIVGFVVALFVLYRVLVAQKDSTIELQKEIISHLKSQIEDLSKQAPDVLLERITKRAKVLTDELASLSSESDQDKVLIHEKEEELKELSHQLGHYKEKWAKAVGLMTEYFCPKCEESPLSVREYHPVFGYVNGREVEAGQEYVEYECGYAIKDGEEVNPCSLSE